MAELADAPDSKSGGAHAPCGFDSHLRHSPVTETFGSTAEGGLGAERLTAVGIADKKKGLVGEPCFPHDSFHLRHLEPG